MVLNLMIGLLHPPMGTVLFVLSRVAKLSFERTTIAILPWLVPLLGTLFLCTYVPEIVLWLPKKFSSRTCTEVAMLRSRRPDHPPASGRRRRHRTRRDSFRDPPDEGERARARHDSGRAQDRCADGGAGQAGAPLQPGDRLRHAGDPARPPRARAQPRPWASSSATTPSPRT